ncbi:hypothetical protein BGX21_002021 [Mortierella sp. AD011]|nr:hypothetical protein BGX21_002021 [Mortierella sp. AD011]
MSRRKYDIDRVLDMDLFQEQVDSQTTDHNGNMGTCLGYQSEFECNEQAFDICLYQNLDICNDILGTTTHAFVIRMRTVFGDDTVRVVVKAIRNQARP